MSDLWKGEGLRLDPGSCFLAGIHWERDALYRRIDERVLRMVSAGLFEEARRLARRPEGIGRAASQCIGYREVFEGEAAGWPEARTTALVQRRTRNLAKQQLTWFRRFPIRWMDGARSPGANDLASAVLDAAR
jgi:tRNA dimethylallyltransferase